MKEIVASKAYQATADASLAALANNPGHGVTPSNLLPCKNHLRSEGKIWQFIYEGADCRLVYTYKPETGTLDDFTVQIDGQRPFQPAAGGGATVLVRSKRQGPGRRSRGEKCWMQAACEVEKWSTALTTY